MRLVLYCMLDGTPLTPQARSQRNFPVADKIREALRAQGVTVDDAKGEWTSKDGQSGKLAELQTVAQPSAGVSLTDEEVATTIAQVRKRFPS